MIKLGYFSFLVLVLLACANQDSNDMNEALEEMTMQIQESAKIVGVECIGQPNNYTLNVSILSPDTGCDQYADWWEVITPSGELIYRRILAHSHVNEQPFTRSGGTVDVGPTDTIIIRAHMNNLGYGTQIYRGIVLDNAMIQDSLPMDFAEELQTTDPLPEDCAF